MRVSTQPHPFACGIAWHARTLDVGILDHRGELLRPRNLPARPETLRKAMAPYRADRVGAVEGLCTWYGLAALWAREGIPLVLGHAREMQALPGGKAKNDQSASHKSAVVLRGGLLPQASIRQRGAPRAPSAGGGGI